MKRISIAIVTLLLLVSLVACSKDNLHAKVEISSNDITQQLDGFTFDIELEDPDEQLEGDLIVYLKLDGKVVGKKKNLSIAEDYKALSGVRFTGLESNTTYNIVIEGTYKGSPVTFKFNNNTLKTKIDEVKEIKTEKDFLDIFDSRNKDDYSSFILMNDLDFTDIDTSIRTKTTFNSTFDGQGFTISNYKTTKNERYMGLFSRLLKDAKIKNLTIDNMIVDVSSDLIYDRDIGLLFSKSSASNVEIEDITITNSSIKGSINSSSTSAKVNVGLLTGYSLGKHTNINVDNTNSIDLKVDKYSTASIGGLIGYANENTELLEATNGGTINIDIKQTGKDIKFDKKDKLIYNNHFMFVGGLIGENYSTNIKSSVTSTNINFVETNLFVNPETNKTKLETSIGGIFGFSSYLISNSLYTGDLLVTAAKYEFAELEEGKTALDTEVSRFLNIGGIVGYYNGHFGAFDKIARSNSSLTITSQIESTELSIRANRLFGYVKEKNDFNAALSKLGYHGVILDKLNGADIAHTITEVDALENFFKNEWILEAIN